MGAADAATDPSEPIVAVMATPRTATAPARIKRLCKVTPCPPRKRNKAPLIVSLISQIGKVKEKQGISITLRPDLG